MSATFFSVGIIIAAASLLGAVASKFRQPLVLAYIFVGIIAASLGAFQDAQLHATLDLFSELGIAFLLFLVGLQLKIDEVRYLGKIAFYTGVGQIVFTSVIGFILSKLLGFGSLESIYIAVALTFSSTIIVVKLLTEKRDLDSLYGKVAVGFLLVQDLMAILALIVIAGVGQGDFSAFDLLLNLIVGGFFVAFTYLISKYLAGWIFDRVADNTELLFLFSIAWAMIFASLAHSFGFSIEIGSFLAGVGLSATREEYQIAARVRPLRDLFIVIFFITLGLKISLSGIVANFLPAVLLSAFVLVGNPLIVMFIMSRLGFKKRTSFLASVTVAQISEFSLIIVALGLKVSHIGQDIVNLVTLVGIITITGSSYVILNSSKIYRKISKYLNFFEKGSDLEKTFTFEKEFSDHVVLIGSGRLGGEILKNLKNSGNEVVVVDFNPRIVRDLVDREVKVIFGDINDEDIFEKLNLQKARIIISTMFDPGDTDELLGLIKEKNINVPIVVTAADPSLAVRFYERGASYVIVPRILSSYYVNHILAESNFDKLVSGEFKKKHLEEMEERAKLEV
ncbi:MAG: cation:proton antiporter [Candidatus Woykebacteria bacterium]